MQSTHKTKGAVRAFAVAIALALAILLCIFALASCTSDDEDPGRGDRPPPGDDDTGDDDSGDDDSGDDDDDDWVEPGARVESSGDVGQYTSLELDADDNPHIVYYHEQQGLKYAAWDGSNWTIEGIDDTAPETGKYTGFKLDEDGEAHISYYDAHNGDLKYATGHVDEDKGSWEVVVVDGAGGDVGMYTCLDLNSDENPLISYFDAANEDLKFARISGSAWAVETVDQDGSVGAFSSLSVDPATDAAYIAYYDADNGDLKMADRSTGQWDVQTVDPNGDVGTWTDIRVSGIGNIYIGYCDQANSNLKFARRLAGEQTWIIETLDDTAKVGADVTIDLDSGGLPWILYQDQDFVDAKLAKRTAGGWEIEGALTDGPFGFWMSLEIDSAGEIVFSHYYVMTKDLLIYPPRTP